MKTYIAVNAKRNEAKMLIPYKLNEQSPNEFNKQKTIISSINKPANKMILILSNFGYFTLLIIKIPTAIIKTKLK